jgi:hypothetical protein
MPALNVNTLGDSRATMDDLFAIYRNTCNPLPAPAPGSSARATDCAKGFCRIPAGCFVMGSPPDEPGRGLKNEDRTSVTLVSGRG